MRDGQNGQLSSPAQPRRAETGLVPGKAAGKSKPEELSWLSSLLGIGSPRRSIFDCRIQDDEQLVHAGDQRRFLGLPSCEELAIEGLLLKWIGSVPWHIRPRV